MKKCVTILFATGYGAVGSALRSGRRGRQFESDYSDQIETADMLNKSRSAVFPFSERICSLRQTALWNRIKGIGLRPLGFLGRHSLLIYLVHQPVLYGLTLVIRNLM